VNHFEMQSLIVRRHSDRVVLGVVIEYGLEPGIYIKWPSLAVILGFLPFILSGTCPRFDDAFLVSYSTSRLS
jgi:hypothetical protein